MTKRSGGHKLQKERRRQALAERRLITGHIPAQAFRDGGWHSPFCSAAGSPCPIKCREGKQ